MKPVHPIELLINQLTNPIGLVLNVTLTFAPVPSPSEPGSGPSPPRDTLQVLVVQDHPLLGSAIARILQSAPDMNVCGIARTGADAAVVAVREEAAVVVMDFNLPDMSGPAAATLIRRGLPAVAIVFHSAEDSETALLDAIDAGATAYLTKSAIADEIVEAVRQAGRGEVLIPVALFAKAVARQRTVLAKQHDRDRIAAEFTPRELDVLKLLAEGLDTIEVSRRLGIATHTVEWHVRHVIEKLGVHSKLQAVIAGARLGLIDLAKP
jgi:two-component system nitrate/nitrite response regulator NarL